MDTAAATLQCDPRSQDCETALADFLGELSSVQQELLEILAAKRDCMAESDLDRMLELQPREEQLCQRLQACHDRRTELIEQAASQGTPAANLEKLASSLNSPRRSELSFEVQHASARMRLLQHQSMVNWVLAQRTMLHLAQLLEIIATGGRVKPTYERGESPASCGALVDREA